MCEIQRLLLWLLLVTLTGRVGNIALGGPARQHRCRAFPHRSWGGCDCSDTCERGRSRSGWLIYSRCLPLQLGWTALHFASQGGHRGAIGLLLRGSADPTSRTHVSPLQVPADPAGMHLPRHPTPGRDDTTARRSTVWPRCGGPTSCRCRGRVRRCRQRECSCMQTSPPRQ